MERGETINPGRLIALDSDARRGTTVTADRLTDWLRARAVPADFIPDPALRLRAVERDLAAHLDPSTPRRHGRQCGVALLTCAHAYVVAVLKRVDSAADGDAGLDRAAVLEIDEEARSDTDDVPSWRLREFLRRQGCPDAFIVRDAHARAGVPGSGVVARPGRQTTRLPSQVAEEDPWRAERKRVRRANDATARGVTVRQRNRTTGTIEDVSPAAHLARRWEADQ